MKKEERNEFTSFNDNAIILSAPLSYAFARIPASSSTSLTEILLNKQKQNSIQTKMLPFQFQIKPLQVQATISIKKEIPDSGASPSFSSVFDLVSYYLLLQINVFVLSIPKHSFSISPSMPSLIIHCSIYHVFFFSGTQKALKMTKYKKISMEHQNKDVQEDCSNMSIIKGSKLNL